MESLHIKAEELLLVVLVLAVEWTMDIKGSDFGKLLSQVIVSETE